MSYLQIDNLIRNNNMCALSISDDNSPYIIPMYYEYEYTDEKLFIIMKSKEYGKKMRCLHSNDKVSMLIMQQDFNGYKSVVVYGKAFIEKDSKCPEYSIIKICVTGATGRIYC